MGLKHPALDIAEATLKRGGEFVTREGLGAIHALYPDEFEYYMMAFELINPDNTIADTFIFPVLPDRIHIDDMKITNIKKTASGVTALINNTFVPKTISISGTFGRRMKLLVGSGVSRSNESLNGGLGDIVSELSETAKTGYGVLKMLERLYNKETELKSGKPYKLIFYNLAYNQSYYVELLNFAPNMDKDTNMVWFYSLTMKTLGRAGAGSKILQATLGNVNKGINDLANDVVAILGGTAVNIL